MGYYYTARICMNGHLITDAEEYNKYKGNFCPKCGANSLVSCPECNTPIPGDYHAEGVVGFTTSFIMPSYCRGCGCSFPWTKKALDAATILINETDEIEADDRVALIESLPYLIVDSPYTPVAQSRMKKFINKAGGTIGAAMKEILVSVASETVKSFIGL